MTDKTGRTIAAELIRRLIEGGLTNYELEDAWPKTGRDRFLAQLGYILWSYYDDDPEQQLSPEQFGEDGVASLTRVLMFLNSDLEYEWPDWDQPSLRKMLRRAVGRGTVDEERRNFAASGTFDVWPFIRFDDYEKRLRET